MNLEELEKEKYKTQADAIRWLAKEHWNECRETRPVQYWMMSWADKIEKEGIK